ncbi:hypothetical protein VIBNIPon4_110019 [Vibrio nigripulchritudo POn4]|uniref:hypothetical protein n=1 Tax=Vibrio nigripulchritudo TaxID=28173 RepID=UPI0003B199EF|nr:hypothetical protein [Vibrio nigripulchritudo]CCN38435.1 hypothetical protein VIBNIAM115_910007 [Vibrio nigripulchritudo AM115]CCN43349.1 hypothetical protein VIBNIFTn2_500001 [Vibrio nigripulchritudo FTn2]CCN63100.1 hypothetical protein VIBNIPon4_110019 [Vibrio nigripulchritudo POn4]
MIRIDLKTRLLKNGKSLSDFENNYVDTLFSKKYITVSIKSGVANDRFALYPTLSQLELLSGGSRSLNIYELFYKLYQTSNDFKTFVEQAFRQINDVQDCKSLVKEIVLLNPVDLERVYTCLLNYYPISSSLNKMIYSIFNYDKHSSSNVDSIRQIFSTLDFKVCIYCNRNYTSNFLSKGKSRPTFTLDHFYQKEKFPILALSLYNLIPSCSVCNSTIKGSNDLEHYENPFSHLYDFHNLSTFKIMPGYKVSLVSHNAKCRGYIKDFKINEVYSVHTSEVKAFVNKRQIFTGRVIKEVARITQTSEKEVKNSVFGDFNDATSMGDKSLAKLMSDLSYQLKV